jgi:hypothetical protein
MEIIFFAPKNDEGNIQLNSLIDNFTIINGLEIYRTIDDLTNRLCNPHRESTIVVLFIINEKTFQELISIKEYLVNNKVILVLPDRRPETLTKAHKLRPRFISYSDTDTILISEVIDKMITAEPKTRPDHTTTKVMSNS